MSWLIISFMPAILWSLSCLIDEYISKKQSILDGYSFISLQSAISIIPAILLLLWRPEALNIGIENIIIFGVLGTFFSLCFVPYIFALKKDGAGIVVPFYQVLPLLVFFFAWLFLGETIEIYKIGICFIIVAFSAASMIDHLNGFRFKSMFLMLLASALLALYAVATRHFVENHHWLDIAIWNYIGAGIIFTTVILLYPSMRLKVVSSLKNSRLETISLFSVQTILDIAANIFWILAFSIAPAAGLVQSVQASQPFFILLLSAIAFYFLPKNFSRPPKGKLLVWRLLCFSIIMIGIYFISI